MSSSPDGSLLAPTPLPRHWGLGEILSAEHNRSVVKTLVLFTFFMVVFPIGTFYTFHDLLLVDVADKTRTFSSGMAAVLAANVVMAAYAIVAIKEDGGEESGHHRPKAMPLKVD